MRAVLLALVLTACKTTGTPYGSDVKVDGADVTPLDAQIAAGTVVAAAGQTEADYVRIVRSQLAYTLGQLNALGGSANVKQVDIQLQTVPLANDATKVEVKYATRLVVGWPKSRPVPPRLQLIFPHDFDGTVEEEIFRDYSQTFYDKFGAKCLYETDSSSAELFWHDFNPRASGCALQDLAKTDTATPEVKQLDGVDVVRIPVELVKSADATEGKKPEYDQVWKDGKLVVVAVFLKDGSSSMDPDDYGTDAYNMAYDQLTAALGAPATSNVVLEDGKKPGPEKTYLKLAFNTAAGPVEAHLFLLGTIRPDEYQLEDASIGPAFKTFAENYPKLTRTADFLIYSGHSGYGKNIREAIKLAQFEKGQYTVVWLDGCDTFTYVDTDVKARVSALNPGQGPFKYVDVLANAMPAPFGVENDSMTLMTKALVEKTKTYREIMTDVDRRQRILVFGEEDNGAPFP